MHGCGDTEPEPVAEDLPAAEPARQGIPHEGVGSRALQGFPPIVMVAAGRDRRRCGERTANTEAVTRRTMHRRLEKVGQLYGAVHGRRKDGRAPVSGPSFARHRREVVRSRRPILAIWRGRRPISPNARRPPAVVGRPGGAAGEARDHDSRRGRTTRVSLVAGGRGAPTPPDRFNALLRRARGGRAGRRGQRGARAAAKCRRG